MISYSVHYRQRFRTVTPNAGLRSTGATAAVFMSAANEIHHKEVPLSRRNRLTVSTSPVERRAFAAPGALSQRMVPFFIAASYRSVLEVHLFTRFRQSRIRSPVSDDVTYVGHHCLNFNCSSLPLPQSPSSNRAPDGVVAIAQNLKAREIPTAAAQPKLLRFPLHVTVYGV
ncbi:hypothetical protein KCP75_10105 [Salmonella enterica subsp. enterica]|nr:hypothetical protein KCP75_10105 [Salmonella enterica subsp. enterica]